MDPLELLRTKIAGFPGYDGDLHRRRSDEFVRSYLGEALTELVTRCGELPPELQKRVDSLLLRLEFADPKSFAMHRLVSNIPASTGDGGEVADEDVAAVELADRAPAVDASSVAPYLDDVTAMLDNREAAMRAAATKP
jgi:hypothetical protein